jgi:hypothetical protein
MSIGSNSDRERALKRISLLIGEDQYDAIGERGLNLSWLVRELIDDHLSEKKIVLDVGDETLGLYQKIVSAVGALDSEFEPFFKNALHTFLKVKIENMQKLEKIAFKKPEGGKK